MLATELPKRVSLQSGVATNDRRSAMSENGVPNTGHLAPAELTGDRSMSNHRSSLPAYHRSLHRRSIADIDGNPAKCGRRIGNSGNIGYIEERDAACRHAISNRWSPDRMIDRKRLEVHSVDYDGFSQRQPAPILDLKALDQIPCLPGRVDRTRSAIGKAASMIRMCMRQHDRSRCHTTEAATPVHPAIDHDACRIALNKQRTVSSVTTGTNVDLPARPEERQSQ